MIRNMTSEEERIATNIRKGVLEFCVLAVLARREAYGLELAQELMARHLTASEGSLYPLLARLRAAGLVETRWDTPDAGRPRRYYTITEAGSQQLRNFSHVWSTIVPQVGAVLQEDS